MLNGRLGKHKHALPFINYSYNGFKVLVNFKYIDCSTTCISTKQTDIIKLTDNKTNLFCIDFIFLVS